MPQIFSPRADAHLRLGLTLALGIAAGSAALAFTLARSDQAWGVGRPAPQPIPFSHALHAGGLGTDCRYCHAAVEREAGAGMPTAELCLGCHNQVWAGATVLAPLRDSRDLGAPIAWSSVHRLPEHARFHHAAHVHAAVACKTCHGQVWTMERTVKVRTMSMGWCLDCHRNPEAQQRPVGAVLDRDPFPAAAGPARHRALAAAVGLAALGARGGRQALQPRRRRHG